MPLRLYNTATRKLEDFTPLHPPQVTMYNCGPTVYNYQHIGNMRSFVFADTIRRVLEMRGFTVRQIVNITDVGHLVGDGDEGEDKIAVGARREGKSVEEIITHYSDAFFADLRALNILPAALYPRATQYIAEQKAMIETLHDKGFTYTTSDGIYFDTSKFPTYADLAKLDIAGLEAGNRVAIGEKKRVTDFALWKFSPTDGAHREQEWDSPLGEQRKGFPGWHIECSAIIKAELGETIDIHTGGIDHIPIHHTNEIAQSESALGVHPFVRLWMHHAHILINNEKMSKSLGNVFLLRDLQERGVPALAYRYWLLTAHYRTQSNVTWEALAAAQSAFSKLTNHLYQWTDTDGGTPIPAYMDEFNAAIDDDLNTASAIALLWKLVKETNYGEHDKYATLAEFEKVLGLGLTAVTAKPAVIAPPEVRTLLDARAIARTQKNWGESDRLRDEVKALGFNIKDSGDEQKLEKI